ncbi:hypothetical protein SI65_09981 [Aspergillus cristatus]|uniref:HTH CENPB-type domain-containing protein n=1 Tax=Aspergillus cristatus TaxID=573508 RepID=A0A1E3B2F3_ASPCR|nr:hypothetical protein SI65_09981 [Aspergillus cristatus]
MADNSKEARIKIALEAYKKGLFSSRNAAAKAYDVPLSTFKTRVNGTTCRKESIANGRKLTPTEEKTLSSWIIDMGQRGLPLQISTVRYLAQLLLSARLSSQTAYVGEHWVTRYIQRHKELSSKYSRKYDYQRAKCEDPELVMGWYKCFYNAIEKYGILEQDIYNMDETGFQMGMTSTAKVICGSETRASNAKAIQPGNREWVTAIIAVNAAGWALPPQIILAAENHQSQWYHAVPKDYTISVSKNGWTNDGLGLEWLQTVFEPHTASRTLGRYRMLILDGHSSHATAEFDRFCTERNIIPLYMPPHSSHLLQPLDVGCFSPLKRLYGERITKKMQKGINVVDKTEFLYIYPTVHYQALSSSNIQSSFAATGLVPFSPERVLSKLHIPYKTPTPPSSSHSNQCAGKTPADINQLEAQKKRINHLQSHQVSPSTMQEAIGKVMRGAEMTMQNAILLQHEVHQLRVENRHQKQRRAAPRAFIQAGGSLTGAKGLQKAQEQEAIVEEAYHPVSRRRKPPTCSTCGKIGHNRLKCPEK